MGGFWDMLDENQVRGKCETNYFHMYVYGDIVNEDISQLDSVTKGTFMHEYLHYLQFINTIFGLSYGTVYNSYFSLCRKHFLENETINIPIKILLDYPELNELIEKYKNLKGSVTNLPIDIIRVEIDELEILNAKNNNTGIHINVIENETGELHSFSFGYLCIIESMAHVFQSFFDPEIEHPQIPYNAVQLICKNYLPHVADDPKMMFSVCLCSLMFNNPAFGFFEVLKIVKINPRLNGQSLYKHVMESRGHYNGAQKPMSEIFNEFMDNYQSNIESAIDNKLDYYSEVFNNCKIESDKGESILLKLLYEFDITSKESIDLLLNFYGFPFVESNSMTLMAKLPKKGSKYMDIALLRGLEMVTNRFNPPINRGRYPIYDPKCSMYDKCLKSLYEYEDMPPFEMTDDCKNKQWQKQDICLMTQSLRYYKLYGKQITQSELPAHMQ